MNSSFTFTGNQLGHYHIQHLLDKGGMALVYKAIDQRNDEVVALKLLYPYLLSDPDSVKRFQREAKIIKSLNHPYVVGLRDFGEIDGHFYLAMRYMARGSLNKYYRASTPFEFDTSLKILKQIASALDYAHERNVIHRDMKMENILLDEDGESALSDFGIARIEGGTRYTQTGQITGTPQYMSPEQAQGKPDIDYRADLYAFAIMAYRMATGTFPFRADDPLVVLNQHVSEMPPTASIINPALPRELDYVLWKGLAKKPKDRYDSASDFVSDFEHAFSAPLLTPIQLNPVEPEPVAIQSPIQEIENPTPPTRQAAPKLMLGLEDYAPKRSSSKRRRVLWAAIIAVFMACTISVMGVTYRQWFLMPDLLNQVQANNLATNTETSETTAEATAEASSTRIAATARVSATPNGDVAVNLPASSTPIPNLLVTNTPHNVSAPAASPTPSRTRTPVVSRTPGTRTPGATSAATSTPRPANTTVGATSVPPTSVPPTSVPPISVPPTSVPPTSVPPTSVPPTAVPPTAVPPTTVPPTAVPPTAVPPTAVPPLLPIIPTLIQIIPTLIPLFP